MPTVTIFLDLIPSREKPMKPEAIDALTRLKAAVAGREPVHAYTKNVLTVAGCEVNPRDVVDLCASLPNDPHAAHMGASSANAIENDPNIPSVHLHVVDVLKIVRAGEALMPVKADPPKSPTDPVTPPATVPPAVPPAVPTLPGSKHDPMPGVEPPEK
jgi:hypothetical protein